MGFKSKSSKIKEFFNHIPVWPECITREEFNQRYGIDTNTYHARVTALPDDAPVIDVDGNDGCLSRLY